MQNTQQQLQVKLKNIPTDASQVCSSISSGLNKEETLSVQNKVLVCNSLDVNHSQHAGSQDLRVLDIVYVLNIRGNPLMPTRQQKANKLLKQGKAKVVKRTPFTIQLNHASGETKQQITLGMDSGYKFVGFSARTEKQELIAGELKLRKDVSKRIQDRAMYRRTRRGKLWYREPRFDNRVKTKKKGWLAPSIQHKIQAHLRLVEKLKNLLPITKIIIEVANFDAQKMQNPEISGIEYQQGELQGYEIREYLLEKFHRTCVYCKKTNIPLQIEHIIPKSRGGSSRVSNLTISCEKCNQKKGTKTATEFGFPELEKQCKASLKSTVFMNLVRIKIVKELKCEYTYGYVTKHNRIKQKLSKSHVNDAFVIAGGTVGERVLSFDCKQVRRNNRKLQLNRKGFKPSVRRQRYKHQPNDIVRYENKMYVVKGVHCYGKQIMISNRTNKPKSVSIKKIQLIHYGKGIAFSVLPAIPPLFKNSGFLEGRL